MRQLRKHWVEKMNNLSHLKRSPDEALNQRQHFNIEGWNACIDHLAAQGLLKTPDADFSAASVPMVTSQRPHGSVSFPGNAEGGQNTEATQGPDAGGDAERLCDMIDDILSPFMSANKMGIDDSRKKARAAALLLDKEIRRALASPPDVRGMMECIRDLAAWIEPYRESNPISGCGSVLEKHAALIEAARSGGKE
jgi:hypothetical protein